MRLEWTSAGLVLLSRSGRAVVERIERAGLELIFWADYGSGIA